MTSLPADALRHCANTLCCSGLVSEYCTYDRPHLFHFLHAEASRPSPTQQAAEHIVCQCTSPCTQPGIQSGCGVTVSSPGERYAKNGADGLSTQPPPQCMFPSMQGIVWLVAVLIS